MPLSKTTGRLQREREGGRLRRGLEAVIEENREMLGNEWWEERMESEM